MHSSIFWELFNIFLLRFVQMILVLHWWSHGWKLFFMSCLSLLGSHFGVFLYKCILVFLYFLRTFQYFLANFCTDVLDYCDGHYTKKCFSWHVPFCWRLFLGGGKGRWWWYIGLGLRIVYKTGVVSFNLLF